ncbi:MAG: cytochrome c biogenesis protein CcmG/thiol:disulfide interchange protein DsbE [Polaribacter sp.]|jgi:cytochrome c biogenesis protein CcmG/thiol:disulfide interchange protein DsbE
MNKYLALLVSFIVMAMIAFSAFSNRNSMASEVTISQYEGKDWTLKNLAGESVTLSDFQGKPTLLIFWATWCPYCKKLLPGIEELHEKYHAQGLKTLGVNIKEDWKPEVYWKNFGYQFDTVINGDDVAKIYGVRGTPGIVFIAPSGKVLGVKSFSDPDHPLLEKFAKEGLALMK